MEPDEEEDKTGIPLASLRTWIECFESARTLSISSARTLNKYTPFSKEVYGEANPEFVNDIITRLHLAPEDVFCDIGSGIGNVVLQVASQTGCQAHGIEVRPELHKIAKRMYNILKNASTLPSITKLVNFYLGDITEQKFEELLPKCTVIYMHNTCFPAILTENLLKIFQRILVPGTKVVTLQALAPRYRPNSLRSSTDPMRIFKFPPEIHQSKQDAVDWRSRPISYFIYKVKAENEKDDEVPDDMVWPPEFADGTGEEPTNPDSVPVPYQDGPVDENLESETVSGINALLRNFQNISLRGIVINLTKQYTQSQADPNNPTAEDKPNESPRAHTLQSILSALQRMASPSNSAPSSSLSPPQNKNNPTKKPRSENKNKKVNKNDSTPKPRAPYKKAAPKKGSNFDVAKIKAKATKNARKVTKHTATPVEHNFYAKYKKKQQLEEGEASEGSPNTHKRKKSYKIKSNSRQKIEKSDSPNTEKQDKKPKEKKEKKRRSFFDYAVVDTYLDGSTISNLNPENILVGGKRERKSTKFINVDTKGKKPAYNATPVKEEEGKKEEEGSKKGDSGRKAVKRRANDITDDSYLLSLSPSPSPSPLSPSHSTQNASSHTPSPNPKKMKSPHNSHKKKLQNFAEDNYEFITSPTTSTTTTTTTTTTTNNDVTPPKTKKMKSPHNSSSKKDNSNTKRTTEIDLTNSSSPDETPTKKPGRPPATPSPSLLPEEHFPSAEKAYTEATTHDDSSSEDYEEADHVDLTNDDESDTKESKFSRKLKAAKQVFEKRQTRTNNKPVQTRNNKKPKN